MSNKGLVIMSYVGSGIAYANTLSAKQIVGKTIASHTMVEVYRNLVSGMPYWQCMPYNFMCHQRPNFQEFQIAVHMDMNKPFCCCAILCHANDHGSPSYCL